MKRSHLTEKKTNHQGKYEIQQYNNKKIKIYNSADSHAWLFDACQLQGNLIFIWKHLLKDSSMTSYQNTSMIAHLMRFPAVPGKKWKWVQIKIWNDVKGISKGNGHTLNTVFIAPLKWWEFYSTIYKIDTTDSIYNYVFQSRANGTS